MIFTLIGSLGGMSLCSWFVYRYQNEDRPFTNEELTEMSNKMIKDNKDLHRIMKTVLTIEELQRMDPTFNPPQIPSIGEPDI